jgi:hypothetical protein
MFSGAFAALLSFLVVLIFLGLKLVEVSCRDGTMGALIRGLCRRWFGRPPGGTPV